MSIRRPPVIFDHVTVVTNALLRSPRLSPGEKGVLCYILSHAASFDLTMQQVIAENDAGRRAIDTIMTSLEAKGYLLRSRKRDGKGRLSGYDWDLTIDELGSPTGTVTPTSSAANRTLDVTRENKAKPQVATSVRFATVAQRTPKKTKDQEVKEERSTSLTGAAPVTDPSGADSQAKSVRETSPPPKIKGVSNIALTVLGRVSTVIDDIPAVAREIIKANNVTGDGWWIAAEKNGSLNDRIHEALRAIERVAERDLARGAAAVLGGMRGQRAPAGASSGPTAYSPGWKDHPGCEYGFNFSTKKKCPQCVAETQTMAAAP